jgi:flagellar hook-associated protein 3 FlgL
MQISLDMIGTQGADFANVLLAASSGNSAERVGSAAQEAVMRLNTVVAGLNTRFGDRTLFAGAAPNKPAMIGSEALLDLLQGVVAGATGFLDAETMLDDWFADPGGFEALAYLGGPAPSAVGIAAGETARLDVTAMDPAIRDMLKTLALPALITRGLLAGQPVAQAELAQRAGEQLMEGQSALADLRARLGTTEAQMGTAMTRNSAEASALEIARAELIGIDPFDTATRLEATQNRLETLYALTARMQRLHLVDYL